MAFVTEHGNSKGERVRITSEGFFGIGTNSPGSLLHLSSDNSTIHINTNRDDTNYRNAGILFSTPRNNSTDGNSHGGRGAIINLGNSNSAGGIQWMLAATASLSTNDDDAALKGKQCGLRLSSFGNIEHWAANNLIMRSQGDGNVGIGTATASHKLDVYGNIVTENGGSFGRGTLTADGQNDVYFFSTSATTNVAQSGAFHNKVRILGGSSQTRTLDLYQVDSGGAHIGSSYNDNNLTFDSAFQWVEFDSRVIIDSDNNSGGALRINNNITNAQHDFYFAQEIVQTLSGSETTTSDREQGAIFIDVNSTTTGGGTSHEHRAYGMYIDLDSTGDSDVVYGIYSNATATPPEGQTSEIAGIYGHAEDNGGAGNVTNVYGVKGLAVSDNSGSDTNSLFGGHFKSAPAADTGDIGAAYGVYGEIEIADNTGDHLGGAYVFRAEFDDNDGVAQTCNSYLYYGNYTGTNPTNSWGVYIADGCDNYFAGPIGIGVDTLSRGPLHIHQGTTGDTQIHMTNSETGTSSSDGFTIFQGAGSSGEDCGFVNREENGRIRFLMNSGTDMSGNPVLEDQLILKHTGQLGIKTTDPIRTLHCDGEAYFTTRVGIGTTSNSGYVLTVKNAGSPVSTVGGIFVDCDNWSTNASEYGILVDIDSSNRTNLTANRTTRGIQSDIRHRVAQNASNTNGTRQSIHGIYASAYIDDTDNNDGKMYQLFGAYLRARVDGVNAADIRGAYCLAQCADNATGEARTVDALRGAYNYAINDGNQTTVTNAYATYSHVNQDDTGGTMTNAYGVYCVS